MSRISRSTFCISDCWASISICSCSFLTVASSKCLMLEGAVRLFKDSSWICRLCVLFCSSPGRQMYQDVNCVQASVSFLWGRGVLPGSRGTSFPSSGGPIPLTLFESCNGPFQQLTGAKHGMTHLGIPLKTNIGDCLWGPFPHSFTQRLKSQGSVASSPGTGSAAAASPGPSPISPVVQHALLFFVVSPPTPPKKVAYLWLACHPKRALPQLDQWSMENH